MGEEGLSTGNRLRIVVFGAHPDDPETGCGGLIAVLAAAGHGVTCAYGTTHRPDQEYFGKSEKDVREGEAMAACDILGATPKFFPFAHDELATTPKAVGEIAAWLEYVAPAIVVAHWPLDTHENHQAVGSILWRIYARGAPWQLYFFEVLTNEQSLGFRPTHYLDIGSVRDTKQQAVFCHHSQDPGIMWAEHEQMHRMRGRECGVQFAEAYVLPVPNDDLPILPVQFVVP
jgi:LmbE family N-acetylglucosaminyl deacetylase